MSHERQPLLDSEVANHNSSITDASWSQFYAVISKNPSIPALDSALLEDHVIALFVVNFDTKSGNVVEYCVPGDSDLSGVEFKAMPSGSHTITEDFVYFRKQGDLFGLSVFKRISVDNREERGARMKSVGILCKHFMTLHLHFSFLEKEVQNQLRNPHDYQRLEDYYKANKDLKDSLSFVNKRNSALLKITHPAGCFSQFIKYMGVSIFSLWRLVLLRKRILFYSPPPVGVACYRVYCCCLLSSSSQPMDESQLQPQFYVNVADIDELSSSRTFVACTTEKIFRDKSNLYDAFVDIQNVITADPTIEPLLHINAEDKKRFRTISQLSPEGSLQEQLDQEDDNNDEKYVRFFDNLNTTVFQTLLSCPGNDHGPLTNEDIKNMGLNPATDRAFITQLIKLYNIDVELPQNCSPCC